MKLSILSIAALSGLAIAIDELCSYGGSFGTCQTTSWCNGRGGRSDVTGACPGQPANVRCCFAPRCGSGGWCDHTSARCREFGGQFLPNLCPGPTNYRCCVGA
ncbi:hypothetical protein V8F06_009297 [Rhypophila decipiens]